MLNVMYIPDGPDFDGIQPLVLKWTFNHFSDDVGESSL